MLARCVAEAPNADQIVLLGKNHRAGFTEYPVEHGRVYLVMGVGFWDGVTWFEIAPSPRTLVSVPSFLFEIVSGTPSRHWEARVHSDGAFTLWPVSFYHEYYHDHLSEGLTDAVEDFKHVTTLLEVEENRSRRS